MAPHGQHRHASTGESPVHRAWPAHTPGRLIQADDPEVGGLSRPGWPRAPSARPAGPGTGVDRSSTQSWAAPLAVVAAPGPGPGSSAPEAWTLLTHSTCQATICACACMRRTCCQCATQDGHAKVASRATAQDHHQLDPGKPCAEQPCRSAPDPGPREEAPHVPGVHPCHSPG